MAAEIPASEIGDELYGVRARRASAPADEAFTVDRPPSKTNVTQQCHPRRFRGLSRRIRQGKRRKMGNWLGGRLAVAFRPFARSASRRQVFRPVRVSAQCPFRRLSAVCRLLRPVPARCHSKCHSASRVLRADRVGESLSTPPAGHGGRSGGLRESSSVTRMLPPLRPTARASGQRRCSPSSAS
jgi:hypothetical protein